MQTRNVFLVLIYAVLDVFLGFGHYAIVVPPEFGDTRGFVGGGILPELAHGRLLRNTTNKSRSSFAG